MSEEKLECKESICKKGKNLCCHECLDYAKCKDKWKCDEVQFYQDCLKTRTCGKL
jgi:hypothetical protein